MSSGGSPPPQSKIFGKNGQRKNDLDPPNRKKFSQEFCLKICPEEGCTLPRIKFFEKMAKGNMISTLQIEKKKIPRNFDEKYIPRGGTLSIIYYCIQAFSCVYQIDGDQRSLIYCEATNKKQKNVLQSMFVLSIFFNI